MLQQISNDFAKRNARATLEKPIALRLYEKWLAPECVEQLRALSPDGLIWVWGARRERAHQFAKMPARNSLVFFRRGKTVVYHGAIAATTDNEELAKRLWGVNPVDGETWPLIYFLTKITPIKKDASVFNANIGRKATDNWQGMTSVAIKDSEVVRAYFEEQFNLRTPPDGDQTSANAAPE